MAGSRYAYVKNFELPDPLLPGTFLVFRLDGHSFHRFSEKHGFVKPNDERALRLMDRAACTVMDEYKDIVLAFGESDEYSFLLRRSTSLYNRRHAKIVTTLTSYFTSAYVLFWNEFFPDAPLSYPPSFDGRIVVYPSEREIRDYFAWRQADTHINNLYNTTFWALVHNDGVTTTEAHEALRGTVSAQKNEILFTKFGINYNLLPEQFRKGSVLVREEASPRNTCADEGTCQSQAPEGESPATGVAQSVSPTRPVTMKKTGKVKTYVAVLHCDIIGDSFWTDRPHILDN